MYFKSAIGKRFMMLALLAMTCLLYAVEPRRLPVSEVREVSPSQIVSVRCRLSSPNLTNAVPRAAILSFFFTDSSGKVLRPDKVAFSSRNGAWKYVDAIPGRFSDEVSVRAPSGATNVKISLSRLKGPKGLAAENMDVQIRDAGLLDVFKYTVAWKLLPFFAMLLFFLVAALRFRSLGRNQAGEPVSLLRRTLASLTAGTVAAFAFWSLGVAFAHGAKFVLDLSFAKDALMFLFLAFLVVGGFRMLENRGWGLGRHPVAVMSIFFLCVHAMVIQLVDGYLHMRMSSDFLQVQKCLQSSNIVVLHQPIFSYWCNHELLLSILGKIFGPHLQVAQYLNALCCVGVLFPVFKLVEQVSGRRIATFVAFLVGAYPTNYLYSTLLTSEYLCAFFLIWAFFFLVKADQCSGDWKSSVYWLALCGLNLGLAQITKPFVPVFLASALVMLLVLSPRIRARETYRRLAGFLILVVVFAAVSKSVQGFYSRIAEPQKVCAEGGNLKQTLVKGLDLEGRGRCSVANAKLVKSMSEKETSEYLAMAIKRDFKEYPVLFAEKFDRVHASEQGIMDWFSVSVKARMRVLPQWLNRLVGNYYLLFRVLFFLGALGFCCTALSSRARLMPGLLSAVFVSGFAVLLMIVEAHGRYRTPMYPFAFVMLAYIDVWLTRDNPVYRRIQGWLTALRGLCKRTPKKVNAHEEGRKSEGVE